MEGYDVRKQIITENKNKLLSDAGLIGLFTIILILVLFSGSISNPFLVSTPVTDKELEEDYKNGKRYLRIEDVQLEYTGYYKENKHGKVIYNCYLTNIDKKDYFVFVPANKSGENPEDPESTLYNYSFSAEISKDKELFEKVSSDYNMNETEFMKSYGVSDKVLDEARSNRGFMFIMWILVFVFMSGEAAYIVMRFFSLSKINKNNYIEELNVYGEIEEVLDNINTDVRSEIKFNSTNIKITPKWFLGFKSGKIFIRHIEEIVNVRKYTRAKKAYGFVKIGYELFINIATKDGTEFVFSVENDNEADEILEILKKDSK